MSKSYRELKDIIATQQLFLAENSAKLKQVTLELDHYKAMLRRETAIYQQVQEQLATKGLQVADLYEELELLKKLVEACGYEMPSRISSLEFNRRNDRSNHKVFCEKYAQKMHKEYIDKVNSGGFYAN